ncbi:MAG: hypothetical protein RLZZ591_2038 [Pseudomonadota bacterium]
MRFQAPVYQTLWNSPLGPMLLAANETALLGAWFSDQKHLPDSADWQDAPNHGVLQQAIHALTCHFAGRPTAEEVPLDLHAGTEFQQAVWHALLDIPWGRRVTYGQLAASVGRPNAVRAVGAAVGRNPVSVLVPCHRVVGADGSLTGYAGGLPRKAALLKLEGVL